MSLAAINAAAMEAIKQSIDSPARNIFYIAEDIASARKLSYNDILKQIGKLDLRFSGIIDLETWY
jgi:hypothetical protein